MGITILITPTCTGTHTLRPIGESAFTWDTTGGGPLPIIAHGITIGVGITTVLIMVGAGDVITHGITAAIGTDITTATGMGIITAIGTAITMAIGLDITTIITTKMLLIFMDTEVV